MPSASFVLLGVAFTTAACVSFATAAKAEFDATHRSINGTGEVLGAQEVEAGLQQIAIGLGDSWQITAPSLAAWVGYGKLEVKKRFGMADEQRVSPYAGLTASRRAYVGVDYGWDFGDQRQHSLTLGGKLLYRPLAKPGGDGRVGVKAHPLFLPNGEYDYYWNGNVSYGGIADYLPYIGHTWAWDSFHIGLILSPQAGFIPLPYVYWRF